MQFLFLSAADVPIFTRNDAETAEWTVGEMSLNATFPYDAEKVIQRGQRIAFVDFDDEWQVFEIRKCRTYEPAHYQEVTAEHIIISELTDTHLEGEELTDITASAAVTRVLSHSPLWTLAATETNPTSSADIDRGSVWQALNTIKQNWNVRIVPTIAIDETGITGRYLSIRATTSTFKGLRLSLESNADEVGITWDDTHLVTALYGYGANDANGDPIKFTNEYWAPAYDHPGHEVGYDYLEDPAATALYGRNGEPRFGYYQNSDIKTAWMLLYQTWKALEVAREPRVTIDLTLRDLQRLGYDDTPIRLYDKALIEVRQTGETLQREVIEMVVDLLDPTQTRPTIGAYIPNIVYIERETAREAKGFSGGGGTGNAHGQTKQQSQMTEYHTEIQANSYQISLRATKTDLDTAVNTLDASITVEAGRITQIVQAVGDNGQVTAASIVLAVNSTGSSVMINADKIILDGETIATQIAATNAKIANLISGQTIASQLWANYLNVVQNADINSAIADDLYVKRLYVQNGTSGGQPIYTYATWRTATISGVTINYLG